MASAESIATHLDQLLEVQRVPDYPTALNGLQLENRSPIRGVAAAVDVSHRVIRETAARGANLLLVHHGMFWGGAQRLLGAPYERLRLLIEHDIAVYAAHLPLDAHATLGNNVLLARELGLEPAGAFAHYQGVAIGVSGVASIETSVLFTRADAFAHRHGGSARMTPAAPGRRTSKWGICTGAGASSSSLSEAVARGLDTVIVGEGPHHTAVEADDYGIVVMYAGHYATETLGVRELGRLVSDTFSVPWTFIDAPTGL